VRTGRKSRSKITALDQVRPVWTGRAILGEGPLWSPGLDRLIFVDIRGSRLIAWSPTDGDAREWVLPEACCWLIERSDGSGFLAALRTRIVHLALDLITGPEIVAELARPEADVSGNRLNDAKADPWGRAWAGSMDDQERETRMALPDRPGRQGDTPRRTLLGCQRSGD
jgi:D-xylonolactonase